MKVCRIAISKNLNQCKFEALNTQANLLGQLRKEIWQKFGSINGIGANHRKIRDHWIKERDFKPLAAKAWKETLRDTLDDIKLYEESAKEKVRKSIRSRTKDKTELKRLYGLLKGNSWVNDSYLQRKMRKIKKHGRTKVDNQIIVENGVYKQFTGLDNNTWLKIPSLERGKMLCIPLNCKIKLNGCLRIILKDGLVYVHHTIEINNKKPCGTLVVGVDKGYTEAFADSKSNFYGKNFGKVLTKCTEDRNRKSIARNKLFQIANKKPHKAKNIRKFNLGRKTMALKNHKQKTLIRNISFQAAHDIVNIAKEIICEDLSSPISKRKPWKKYNRLMSSWAKGSLAEALETVTKARGSCLRLVNSAYTSQMDSKTHHLEGRRVGDKFYHVNGEVSHADTNAAINIEHRGSDTDITRFTPHKEVKAILLNRLTAKGRVSSLTDCDRPSMTLVAYKKLASTENEIALKPINV